MSACACGRSGLLAALAALAALALVAGAAPRGPTSACHALDDMYSTINGKVRASRAVSVQGHARTLRVVWDGRAPGRAAAALLAATLSHALRYRRVELALAPAAPHKPPSLCSLAQHTQINCSSLESSSSAYDFVVLSPGMSWTSRCYHLEVCGLSSRDAWVPEPRVKVQGAGVGLALRLHAALTHAALSDRICARAHSWDFYMNATTLKRCFFHHPTSMSDSAAIVYTLTDHKAVTEELATRIQARALPLQIVPLASDRQPRTKLLHLLDQRMYSFLFLDYEVWNDKNGVISVTPPPPLDDTGSSELESLISVKVAYDLVLRQNAPTVLNTLQQFEPSPNNLREILEIEAKNPDAGIENAACTWAIKNKEEFESYQVDSKQEYWISVFLCTKDPDKNEYKKVANTSIEDDVYDEELELRIKLYFVEIECSKEEELGNEYFKTFLSDVRRNLIGVVAAGLGMEAAAETTSSVETALVLYDVPGPRVRLGAAARAAAGSAHHLATAIAHFLAMFEWKRLALLTEDTEMAKGLLEALERKKKLTLYNTRLLAPAQTAELLKYIQSKEARIIFVNTNAELAEDILCKAHKLQMTDPMKYVWILRERRAVELKCDNVSVHVNHFTISFWWRGGDSRLASSDSSDTQSVLRKRLSSLWGQASWPPLAAPLADSLQFLAKSFKKFARSFPNKFYDLHGRGTSELLLNSHNEQEMYGVVQQLQFKNGTLVNPLIFVDRWKSDRHEPLLQWRIQGENVELLTRRQTKIYDERPPTDGSRFCIFPTGHSFFPRCNDRVFYGAIGFVIIVCIALYLARRVRLKRLARRDALLMAQLLAQREFVANTLVDHYVDRAALELYHELGRGCYGRVRYGVLRAPEHAPVSVAVKEARDDVSPAEESELLREACTIAALQHDHVVRLIGVCTTGGPVLVLMEYAFFGDLREYLCQRRHLIEREAESNFDESDEIYHVSAASLTRLAKEAASALEYLAEERLVHRDVRASNCLVDARRSLKLGDFGLARNIGTGLGGEAEYACRRRGLFPVLWMAPESLERGVFTSASDAWALGVLLLELVTLGARPYAAWSPLRVINYVVLGGHPPLPPDASPDTRHILRQCWRSSPEERLSAGALVALLRASPEALRPALAPHAPASPAPPASPASLLADCPPDDTTLVDSIDVI